MDLLVKTIEEKGNAMPFEQFMQRGLYDPDFGYYTRYIRSVGRTGDFSTSATITPLLGMAISRWLRENKKDVASAFRWHVIEVGGGNGDLALAILRSIPFWQRWQIQYHLVDISPNLKAKQQTLLRGYPVKWHDNIHSALKAAQGRALIFSNELVDAFPCVILRKSDHRFQELYLSTHNGKVEEIWKDDYDLRLKKIRTSAILQPDSLKNGQRCEIHLSYRDWLESWGPLWEKGHMLTIDYGDVYPDLYYRRPDGTARGYFMHQRIEGTEIYQRMGKQDLTVDVNFSDLIQWGEEFKYSNFPLMNQRDFLFRYLPSHYLQEGSAEKDCIMALEGAGNAYKVLWQSKNS